MTAGYLIAVITVGLITRSIVSHMYYIMHVRLKNRIRILEANTIRLNGKLRRGLQRKIKTIRDDYPSLVFPGSKADLLICEIYNNPFDTSKDFQNYFNAVEEFNSLVQSKRADRLHDSPLSNNGLYLDVGAIDFRLDHDILTTMKELVVQRQNLHEKIDYFNQRFAGSKDVTPFTQSEIIKFDAMKKVEIFLRGYSDEQLDGDPNELKQVSSAS